MERFNRKVQWDVKRSVYIASAFYLFYYGGKACLFPFITLYFRQIGLSASQTGLIFSVKSFLWFCVSPIWMTLHFRVNKTKTILCFSIFIVIGSNLALTLLPPADPKLPLYVCLNESPPYQSDFHHDKPQNITTTKAIENLTAITTQSSVKPDTYHHSPTTKPAIEVMSTATTTTLTSTTPTMSTTPEATNPQTTIKQTTRSTSEQPATQAVITTGPTVSTTTEMSTFQLAKKLVPIFEDNGVTSDDEDEIEEFISEYKVTQDWALWKQSLIRRQIVSLLEKHESEKRRPFESNFAGRLGGRGRRWSRLIGDRKKRDASENGTESSSILDVIKSINFTSLSEKKDAVLKNLTNTFQNFAHDIKPYLSSNTNLFLCVLIIVAAGELLSAPVEHVSDNSLYNLLDELDSVNQYGKHRVSALVGAGLCGITVSIIVYFTPCFINGTINRFHIHFYLFAMLLGISFMLAPFYPSYDSASNSARSRITGGHRQKCSTCTLMACSSCRHFLLFITIFIIGVTQAPVQNFILWTIQDMDGASELVYGSYVSANAICAMISSLFGRKLIKILKPCTVALMSMMSIAIQLIVYAFMPSPWVIIPVQLLNITGLSFLWSIVTHHTSTTMSSSYGGSEKINSVHVFARASQQRSLHATYVSVYQGLSFSFGSVISGFLYDYLEGNLSSLFIACGILVAVWGMIFACYQCCCLPMKLRRKYSHLVSDSDSDINLAENKEFGLKHKEKNGSYYSVKEAKKKRSKERRKKTRFPIDTDSQSSDAEQDWLKATMKKESRML